MILDIGCGKNPRGNINVELHLNRISKSLKTPNLIKADAHYLPFNDNSFKVVCCYAVLEHVQNPTKVLKEIFRVAKETVKLMVPHRYFRMSILRGQPKGHIHFFSCEETKKWIRALGFHPQLEVTRRSYPEFLSIVKLPHLIFIKINICKL